MSMLTWYLVALVIGGTLVGVSLLFGGDHDGDHDTDAHGDTDHEASTLDVMSSLLPLGSLRFWTFFLAFFGATGLVMTAADLAGRVITAIVAAGVGYACGASITFAIRRLHRDVVDSSLGEGDYVGATARVVLPVSTARRGKVRLELKDRVVEAVAQTEDQAELAAGEPVIIYAVKDDGSVVVSRMQGGNDGRADS